MQTIVMCAIGFTTIATLATAPAQAGQMTPEAARAAREIYQNNGCSSCHASADAPVGPSLQAIAERYQGKQVSQALAQRIREGSTGRYGDLPHPPQALSPEDAEQVARWILAGAPGM